MKASRCFVLFLAVAALAPAAAVETDGDESGSPVNRVVALIRRLKNRVEVDGRIEQRSYDKYACWVEDTLTRKAAAIKQAKEDLATLQKRFLELKADLGSLSASIAALEKDIEENKNAQKEATELRQKEHGEYRVEKTESEQCIGALEAAIKVLTGAGTKAGFLQKLQEAQLLSAVAGVRGVIERQPVSQLVSQSDFQVMRHFVEKPQEFVGAQGMSAAQTGQNPFGDYAPQSTQIQGILKGLYDSFTSSLEKSNAEESEKQKAYEAFMATKQQELETLELSHRQQTKDEADSKEELATGKETYAETEEQLKADEVFFEETKAAGKQTAIDWAERTRLRTEELAGMIEAMQILSSPEARRIFHNASTTFLQLRTVKLHTQLSSGIIQERAQSYLQSLAAKASSSNLAKVALAAKDGGKFEKVIAMIDHMIETLRKEEQADIEHRDRCQNGENANGNKMADLDHDINKADDKLERQNEQADELRKNIQAAEDEINETKVEMQTLLDMRNQEHADFVQGLKDDVDAIQLLEDAISKMSRFYVSNKIPMALAQQPAYTVDPDKAPELVWGEEGGNYGGRKGETTNVIGILEMIKEDLEKEVGTSREEDAQAQSSYEKQRGAMQESLDATMTKKTEFEKDLATLEQEIAATEAHKAQKGEDLNAAQEMKKALYSDCSWVKEHFEDRREKRKVEIQGLQDAKDYLAGVEAGDNPLPPP